VATCRDCDAVVVWLRRPDGTFAPPVEPVLDFADGEYVIATGEGVIQAIPQIYKRHRCLNLEERLAKSRAQEMERERLIQIDRERRRIAQEEEAFRHAQERAEEQERKARERALAREASRTTQQEKQKNHLRAVASSRSRAELLFKPERLLPYPCRDCGALGGEPCRSEYYNTRYPDYWLRQAHNARYVDGPPGITKHRPERWADDYDGPWPPADNDPGRYEMVDWLRRNYITVFEPERHWLTPTEESTLTEWLHRFGDIFQAVKDEDDGTG